VEAQALLRHQIPDGDLSKLFDRALDALLRDVRRTKFAESPCARETREPRTDCGPASRHIPAAIKRAVVERDQGRCTFVARDGRRCGSRDALEFHHSEPFARARRHRAEGITLRCRAHNRHAAVQDYGADHMARFRRPERRGGATGPGASSRHDGLHPAPSSR
jgi:5-methylcytosine-specific restriction endonuclease McrA